MGPTSQNMGSVFISLTLLMKASLPQIEMWGIRPQLIAKIVGRHEILLKAVTPHSRCIFTKTCYLESLSNNSLSNI